MKPTILANTAKISHDEWLELRHRFIGGSDAATVVGLNPYSSRVALYLDKKGMSSPKEESEAMRLGTDLEDYVAQRFTEKTGKKVRRDRHMYLHPEYPFLGADVDRRVVGEDAILECKTTRGGRWDFEAGEVPPHWYCQCLHYLNTTGAKKCYLAILHLGKGFYVFEIARDEEQMKALLDAEISFWCDFVEKDVLPSPDGSESAREALKTAYGATEETEANLMIHDGDLAEYERLKDEETALKKEIERLKQNIQVTMGSATEGFATGWRITWKTQTRDSIDNKKLKDMFPEAWKACARMSASRVMRISKLED